jgi:hypothetical protein
VFYLADGYHCKSGVKFSFRLKHAVVASKGFTFLFHMQFDYSAYGCVLFCWRITLESGYHYTITLSHCVKDFVL